MFGLRWDGIRGLRGLRRRIRWLSELKVPAGGMRLSVARTSIQITTSLTETDIRRRSPLRNAAHRLPNNVLNQFLIVIKSLLGLSILKATSSPCSPLANLSGDPGARLPLTSPRLSSASRDGGSTESGVPPSTARSRGPRCLARFVSSPPQPSKIRRRIREPRSLPAHSAPG